MNKIKILCVISARGGSLGIKNKNIINFCGEPLITWSINQALKSKYISSVYISTDSLKIAKVAKKYGAKVLFLRKKRFSSKNSSKFLTWKNALFEIENHLNEKFDFFLDLDCTNPLRSSIDIDRFIMYAKKLKNFDSLITIAKSRKNPYFNMIEKNKSGLLKVSKKLAKWPTSRQTAPIVYDQVASMYMLKTSYLRKSNSLYDGRVRGYILKDFQNFDIDSELDLEIITNIFKLKYLNKSNV